jgi:hypothetical protein
MNEINCIYVSSRGLLKSCKIKPNPPISSCKTNIEYLNEFIKDQDRYEIKYKEITLDNHKDKCVNKFPPNTTTPVSIYVCCDALNLFIRDILPFIRVPFYLVCGDGDLTTFGETVENPTSFLMFVLSPFLRGFFSQNMDISSCREFLIDKITKLWYAKAPAMTDEKQIKIPTSLQEAISFYTGKIRQIPIGMDYHTIYTNPHHKWRNMKTDGAGNSPKDQESLIMDIRKNMRPFYLREYKIYSNVLLLPDRFNDRVTAVSKIPKILLEQQNQFITRTNTWMNMTNFAFVLSPFGNGLDCHRTWEALLCGCIPIVRTKVFQELFYGLPVLIVDDWSHVTKELLEKTIEEFKLKHENNEFRYEKLTLEYYTQHFT